MKKGRSLPNIKRWHNSRWRPQTLWAETMNLIKYSRVNQQTKMASVTFRKRVSSASSSSVPSWKSFKYNRSLVLFPYTKHVSCGVLESGNCWEDEEKHWGEKKEWAGGHKNLQQFEMESTNSTAVLHKMLPARVLMSQHPRTISISFFLFLHNKCPRMDPSRKDLVYEKTALCSK